MKSFRLSYPICISMIVLIASHANAYTVSYYRSMMSGWSGNSRCFATNCIESSPKNNQVNCHNFSSIDFSIGQIIDQEATGYAWFNWLPEGPKSSDLTNARTYTIDGNYNIRGFRSQGNFRSPIGGRNEEIDVRSAKVDFLPPYGARAIATVDFDGSTPLVINLECCTDGRCDSEMSINSKGGPHVQPFQDPPSLCPSFPKVIYDKCMGIKSNVE